MELASHSAAPLHRQLNRVYTLISTLKKATFLGDAALKYSLRHARKAGWRRLSPLLATAAAFLVLFWEPMVTLARDWYVSLLPAAASTGPDVSVPISSGDLRAAP